MHQFPSTPWPAALSAIFLAPAFSVALNFPPVLLPSLLGLDCQIIRLSSGPLSSKAYLIPSQMPSTVPLIFCSSLAYGFCWSPATPICARFLPCLQSTVQSPGLTASGGHSPGQVCAILSSFFLFGARCLGFNWGLEVPGHPVLGSLHSPSTQRRVSFGRFPLPGLPWIPPFWVMASATR